ncbi:MAG: GNAT family N-acetyltransferase [Cyanobacteria bacterium J06626_6]
MLSQNTEHNPDSRYRIKTATRKELDKVLEWAAAEGWNPGLQDAESFYATDPNGFLIGTLNGEPIASISAVKYDEKFGFIGFYIVLPDYRGLGYGLQIWKAGLSYLQERTVGLDGVLQQQNNYVKSGFQLAHRNIRYEGRRDTDAIQQNIDSDFAEQIAGRMSPSANLVPLSSVPFRAVLDYDRALFLSERADFLKGWIGTDRHVAVGAMYQQALAGYGVLRPCQQGYKIGPLLADSPELAEAIFLALATQVEPHSFFYLDVPEVNSAAVAIAKKYQMSVVFETARMYKRTPLELPLNRIFGITSFELG